jgi:hypothetical protein
MIKFPMRLHLQIHILQSDFRTPEKYDKLISASRTADDVLDKEATPYNDIFNAFRLALKLQFQR